MKKLVSSYLIGTLITSMAFAQSATTTTSTTTAPAPSKFSGVIQEFVGQSLVKDESDDITSTTTAFSLGYKPSSIKYSVSTAALYNFAGKEKQDKIDNKKLKANKVTFTDLTLSAGAKLGKVIGSEDAAGKLSLILPTTEKSLNAKNIAGVQGRLDLGHKATDNLSLMATIKPTLTARQENVSGAFKNELSAGVSYSLTDSVSTSLTLEHVVSYTMGQRALKKVENIGPELGVGYAPNQNLDLSFFLTQERNALNPTFSKVRSKYAILAPEETSATLVGTVLF